MRIMFSIKNIKKNIEINFREIDLYYVHNNKGVEVIF